MLENDLIKLRALEPEDLDFLYDCENNTDIWRYGSTVAPYSRYALKQFIADAAQTDIYSSKQLRLIICVKAEAEKPVGTVDLFDYDPYHQRASVGIVVSAVTDRQKGIASQALQLAIDYCFNFLHLHQLYCSISASNIQSISLFEKQGFVMCGCRKQWLKTAGGYADELEYQLINNKQK